MQIDRQTHYNYLDFFFMLKGCEGKSLGEKVWFAIEKRYPQTKKWSTTTPYFEKRNIHFYVNKCKFKIIEFCHPKHTSNFCPPHPILKNEEFFYFVKDIE